MTELKCQYLAQQGPDVLAQVGADGSQQQSLHLDELEHQLPVHPLDGQLPVLVLRCLEQQHSISPVLPGRNTQSHTHTPLWALTHPQNMSNLS